MTTSRWLHQLTYLFGGTQLGTPELLAVAGTDSDERMADIVFVHGLNGNNRATWQFEDDEHSFWPRLLYNDLPDCGVWSFGYDARASKWLGQTMPIVDRATNFAAFLQSEHIGERPLFFVAHSLGGLIVKQMLRSAYDLDQESILVGNTKTVFFFATPHFGSSVADIVQWLKFSRPSALVDDLQASAPPLRDLNNWYRANSQRLNIGTEVFRETQRTKGLALIVNEQSSDPGITGINPIPVDADHSGICKLSDDDMAYKIVRNSIQESLRGCTRDLLLSRSTDLWMDVACFNKYPDQWEERTKPKGNDRIMSYEIEKVDAMIQIGPRLPYLEAARQAVPVRPIDFMWQPFRWLPLTLDLKFLNQSASPAYVTELKLHVERSETDTEPVLFVQSGNPFPELCILNDGWGLLSNVELRLSFQDGARPPAYPSGFTHLLLLEDFETELPVRLYKVFARLGVDVDGVMDWKPNPSMGPFTSGRVFVYGELTFTKPDGSHGVFRFTTAFQIEGALCSMYGPPTFEYQTHLRPDGSDYTVAVPVSQILQPGESDRVLLQIDVARSSKHRLTIEASGNRPTLAKSHPIDLAMFVPRSVAEHLEVPEDP